MPPEATRVLFLVTKTFEDLRIPYLVGGSVASGLYGVARSSLDLDLFAMIRLEQVRELVARLGADFSVDEQMIRDAIELRSSFNLIHLETMFKVDVFLSKERPFDQMRFKRWAELILASKPVQKAIISSAEDIILTKLEEYRLGGEISDQQWWDILDVLNMQAGKLNMDYLQRWAADLNLDDLLLRALEESE